MTSTGRGFRRNPPTLGFTLIELMIVVTILLILMGLVVILFNSSFNSERIRGAARQTQSMFLGAQSRAALKRVPRGLRLVQDKTDSTVVTGFVYIGYQAAEFPKYTAYLSRDGNGDGNVDDPMSSRALFLRGVGSNWHQLAQRGLITDGTRVRIQSNESWYTVSVNYTYLSSSNEVLVLNSDYRGSLKYPLPAPRATDDMSVQVELQPSVLAEEQPVSLPSGIVIDLDHSRIPSSWYLEWAYKDSDTKPPGYVYNRPHPTDSSKKIYRKYLSQKLDVLFTPRGMVRGATGAFGMIHLLLADTYDTDQQRVPWRAERDNLLVTLITRTGAVSTHPIFVDLGANGVPGAVGDDDSNGKIDDVGETAWPSTDDSVNDLYRYAETGAVAGK